MDVVLPLRHLALRLFWASTSSVFLPFQVLFAKFEQMCISEGGIHGCLERDHCHSCTLEMSTIYGALSTDSAVLRPWCPFMSAWNSTSFALPNFWNSLIATGMRCSK